jgi:release factor glutamine methyltransferase
VNIAEAQQAGAAMLRQAKIDSYRLDTDLLLSKVLDKPRAWVLAHPEHELTDPEAEKFNVFINRRGQHTPLVHLTNHREFYGLDFYIDKRVLTPRVETEQMAEWAIKYTPKNSKLIDVGTGSGALAIAIKKHRPDLDIWATDVSAKALEVAAKNVTNHSVAVQLVTSDLFDNLNEKFVTVVTNLPYLQDDADLMPEVQKEPAVALFGGQDGLDLYRRFLEQLPQHLEPSGYLFTECDPWQHESLIKLAAELGLRPIEQGYFILGFQYRPSS